MFSKANAKKGRQEETCLKFNQTEENIIATWFTTESSNPNKYINI